MDSARHSLFAVAETNYGVTPATPALKTIRHTSASPALSKQTFASEELRADRQQYDFRHGVKQTGGDIMGELSYAAYDDFLEAVLCGTWAAKAAPYTASTISAAAADNSINDSANGLPVLMPGDKVTIAGFTGAGTTANQTSLTVVSSTLGKMVLAVDTGHPAFVNDAAGEAVTVTTLTQRLKCGTTRRSFSLLRYFADAGAGQKGYHIFTGQELNKLTLTATPNPPVKLSFGLLGKTQGAPSDTAPAGSTYPAAPTGAVMDLMSGIVRENGAASAIVSEFTLTLENGLEPRPVLGSDSTIKPSIGRCSVTGQITAYFEDSGLLEKFLNETESSFDVLAKDALGNGYRFLMPRIKYNGGQPDTQGQAAITAAYPIQALADSGASALIIEKIPA